MGSIAFNFWWKWALARTPGELLFSGQKGRATKRTKHTEEEEEQTNRKKKKNKTKKAATATVGDFSMEPNRAIAVFAVWFALRVRAR